MAAGVNALQSFLDRMKKKAPFKTEKISVVFFDPLTEEYDLPPEDKINKNGILLIPREMSPEEWELENIQKSKSSHSQSECST